jgi:enoyl-CoA hydratase/carnithine racemase
MRYRTIDYRLAGEILTLTLNRAERLNTFTVEMANELIDAFGAASADPAVRAVVVTGSGHAFCAGMDLSATGNVFGLDESMQPTLADMRDRLDDPAIATGVRDTGGRVALAIFACTKPVVAAINGAAIGIGATMTLPMDVRIASEGARFGFVFSKVGITPEACSTWFLPRLVGISQALQWACSADVFDAAEALRGGLVSAVIPERELLAEAYRTAKRFVQSRSAVSVALIRQMMWRNSALPHPLEAHRIESLAMFHTSLGDGKEGVQAFREKRDPRFASRVPDDLPRFYEEWSR